MLRLLPNYMQQNSSQRANSCSASQEIPNLSSNPNVHYRVHNSPPLVPIRVAWIRFTSSHPILLRFILILPSRPQISEVVSSLQFFRLKFCTHL